MNRNGRSGQVRLIARATRTVRGETWSSRFEEEWVLERRHTMRRWSLDARSEGQPWPLFLREVWKIEDSRWARAVKEGLLAPS